MPTNSKEGTPQKRLPRRLALEALLIGLPAAVAALVDFALPDPVSAQDGNPPKALFDCLTEANDSLVCIGNTNAENKVKAGEPVTVNDLVNSTVGYDGHQLNAPTSKNLCASQITWAYEDYVDPNTGRILNPMNTAFEVTADNTPACFDDPAISGRASGAAWDKVKRDATLVIDKVVQNPLGALETVAVTMGAAVGGLVGIPMFVRWVMNGLVTERYADAVRSTGSAPSKTKQLSALSPWNQAPTPASVPVTPTQENPWEKRWAEQERKDKAARRFRVEDYWGASEGIVQAGLERMSSVGRASSFVTGYGIFWGPKHANAAPLYDEIGDLPDIEISQGPKMPKGNKHKSRKSDWKVTGGLSSPSRAKLPEHVVQGKFREISRKD